jgi:hypothetical protein
MEIKKKIARSFNFTFHYIDDVLSLNNSRFGVFVDHTYPIEVEIKERGGCFKRGHSIRTCPLARGVGITAS